MIFKCKMCGGGLEVTPGATVAECEYCGTQQTLPRLDDDRKANLYDRANHFRRNNEFDKAMGIYEQILNEDSTDAEAYWSLVLCRYGIEYVEDPASRKRLPTVNRAQFTSVFDDDNYKSALQYADSYQKTIYEAEATAINEIQKGILSISQKEDPFDVFICYKETDNNGRRTPDSVLAQELYYQLTQEGFKVFFSRITLEDKLGSAYEPYIFAALNSAKIMVAMGTKPEYFKAVWVRNEWSRYLALIKFGAKKMLIPAYKDMDPYDLPEEFSHLQAQDMSKLGFMQDLIRGIKKILDLDTPKTTVIKETVVTNNANTAPLLKRVFLFLEDGDWDSANEYCEKVLDIDPECAQAYLGKLMVELRVRKQEQLKDQAEPFDRSNNYQKALRFADSKLKNELAGCIEHINTRNESVRLEGIYSRALNMMKSASSEASYKEAASLFLSVSGYKDAAALAEECRQNAAKSRKESIYRAGVVEMTLSNVCIENFTRAIAEFQKIPDWKDADEKIIYCQQQIEALKAKAEVDRLEQERTAELDRIEAIRRSNRKKMITAIVAGIACLAIIFAVFVVTVIIPNNRYNKAIEMMAEGKYQEAVSLFEALGNYKDAQRYLQEASYSVGTAMLDTDKVAAAIAFGKSGDYKDATEKSMILWDQIAKRRVVDVGCYYVIAVSENGKAMCNNNPIDGGLNEIKSWDNLISVAGGNCVAAGLRQDGTVVAVGDGVVGVSEWRNIVQIEAGSNAIAGLRMDGTVVCTDSNLNSKVSSWSNIIAIDMEDSYIIGLRADGIVVCTGWDIPSDWNNIVQIAAGNQHCVGLRADGTVVAVGDGVSMETAGLQVDGWRDIVSISAAYFITYGIKSDGTVISTGKALSVWGQDYGLHHAEKWESVETISSSYINVVCIHKDGTISAIIYESQANLDHDDWNLLLN